MSFFLCFLLGLSQLTATVTRNEPPLPNIVCLGNSLTHDTDYAAEDRYPGQLATLYGDTATVTNSGVAGQTTTEMQAAIATQAYAFFLVGQRPNVAVAWEITNGLDFGSQDATTEYNAFVTYCGALRTKGFYVVALTVLPRTDAGVPAGFEANRQTVNTSIRANWPTFASALYDCAADARLSDSTNTTYFRDLVHLTATGGYPIIAAGVKAAVSQSLSARAYGSLRYSHLAKRSPETRSPASAKTLSAERLQQLVKAQDK